MKVTLPQKLAAYSAMSLPFLMLSEKVDGQVTYVDLVPDINIPDVEFELDITGDGNEDFDFFGFNSGPFTSCYALMLPDAYNAHIATDGDGYHKTFEFGEPLTFVSTTDYLQVVFNSLFDGVSHGPLTNAGEKFIGAFVEDGPDIVYLWMRVNVTPCSTKLMDYAYSNDPLLAGEGIGICNIPVPLGSVSIDPTTQKIKWDPVVDVYKYQIKYRPVGWLIWYTKNVSAPAIQKKLTDLTCETNYEWKIKTLCADGDLSAFSDVQYFTTMDCRLGKTNGSQNAITVYPNPAAGNATIYFDEPVAENSTMTVFDLTGKILLSNTISGDDHFILDVSNLSNGIYFVEVNSGTIKMRTELFVQQ
ncbi:MAG: T9SS type A sorting domain-containing protein [Chitinophagales bacterium]